MLNTHSVKATQSELTQLHLTTCVLMTRFINGHHCPKLAHMIVRQLGCLVTHPQLEKLPTTREMYQQLLEHWQNVTRQLLEEKSNRRQRTVYH